MINSYKYVVVCVSLFLLLLTGCSKSSESVVQVTVAKAQISNGKVNLHLNFSGKLELANGNTREWTPDEQAPYITAAGKWLQALKGIKGSTSHDIEIIIKVNSFSQGLGAANVDSTTTINGQVFPAKGELIISNETYSLDFLNDPAKGQTEFEANILHEMGHIFGIGTLWQSYVSNDATLGGNIFRKTNSEAVKRYQQLYNTTVDFVPVSDDGGHLYDYINQEDKQRQVAGVLPLTKEIMANGQKLGEVTLGILDDMGWEVDYTKAGMYTP